MADADAWSLFGEPDAPCESPGVPQQQTQSVKALDRSKEAHKLDLAWHRLVSGYAPAFPSNSCTSSPPAAAAPFENPANFYHPALTFASNLPHRGGGRGFIVNRDIQPGTLLLSEAPFLPPGTHSRGEMAQFTIEELCLWNFLQQPAATVLAKLPDIFSLHPQSLSPPTVSVEHVLLLRERHGLKNGGALQKISAMLAQRVEDNEDALLLSREVDETVLLKLLCVLHFNCFESGLYLHLAIINHSCRANSVKRYIDEEGVSEVWSTSYLQTGDEVTINYLSRAALSRRARQHRLREQFQFRCDCDLCQAEGSQAEALLETRQVVDRATSELTVGETKSKANEDIQRSDFAEKVRELELSLSQLELRLGEGASLSSQAEMVHVLECAVALANESGSLHPRHIVFARCNQLIAECCAMLLSRPNLNSCHIERLRTALTKQLSESAHERTSFRVLLLEEFLDRLLALRETQLLFLLEPQHPDALATLADLAQAISMLMGQGVEGRKVLDDRFGSFSSALRCEAACRARLTNKSEI